MSKTVSSWNFMRIFARVAVPRSCCIWRYSFRGVALGTVRVSTANRIASDIMSRRMMMLGGAALTYTSAGWLDLLWQNGATAQALVTFLLLVAGTGLALFAMRSDITLDQVPQPDRRARLLVRALLATLVISSMVTAALAVTLFFSAYDSRIYDSDAAAFNHYNAELVLRGQNPYMSDNAFWDALRQFPDAGATPLRAGRYAGSTYGPSLSQIVSDIRYELAHPKARGPEYAAVSLHSYPALAFLVYVPGVWAGLPTTFYISLMFLVMFFLAAGWGAPRAGQPAIWLLLLASSLVVFWTLRGSFEVIALLPALLAWRLLDRRWLSPVLLGFACAAKQIIWPLVPLYTILVWKREGPRAALWRLVPTLGAFLAPNLPFIVASPGAWASSMLLPVTLPIFPSGVGLVGLARGGVLPLLPPSVYALLEVAALVALGIWLARTNATLPHEFVLILGLLPFALSWHSLFTYFMCVPALAVAGCIPLLSTDTRAARAPLVTAPPVPDIQW